LSASDEIVQELCGLVGWLLAHQAGITAEGELAAPRALFTSNEKPEGAQLLVFNSESYQSAVEEGRVVMRNQCRQFRCWALGFDVNLRSPTDGSKTGDALWVEAGAKGLEHSIAFVQRYAPKTESSNFHLVGKVELTQPSNWSPTVRQTMESVDWYEFLGNGARSHPLAGEVWDQWEEEAHEAP